MTVPNRYSGAVLLVLFGVLTGVFVWIARVWYGELATPSRSIVIDGHARPRAAAPDAVDPCALNVQTYQDPVSKVCADFARACDVPLSWVPGCTEILASTPTSSAPTSTKPAGKPKTPKQLGVEPVQ